MQPSTAGDGAVSLGVPRRTPEPVLQRRPRPTGRILPIPWLCWDSQGTSPFSRGLQTLPHPSTPYPHPWSHTCFTSREIEAETGAKAGPGGSRRRPAGRGRARPALLFPGLLAGTREGLGSLRAEVAPGGRLRDGRNGSPSRARGKSAFPAPARTRRGARYQSPPPRQEPRVPRSTSQGEAPRTYFTNSKTHFTDAETEPT